MQYAPCHGRHPACALLTNDVLIPLESIDQVDAVWYVSGWIAIVVININMKA